jgi:hypothetical protein
MYRKIYFSCFFLLYIFLLLNPLLRLNISFSQSIPESQKPVVTMGKNSEIINFPFSASNFDRQHPDEYVLQTPKPNNWILQINNNISYTNSSEAKTVIKIKEPYPSEKFIELTMFGDKSKKFIVATNNNETGYITLYENDQNGWSTDGPIVVTNGADQGLSVSNGKRIVIDKLSLNGFTVGSIDVSGKDESNLPDSALGGSIQLELFSGDVSKSPLYYMPLFVEATVGGLVIALVIFIKRRS